MASLYPVTLRLECDEERRNVYRNVTEREEPRHLKVACASRTGRRYQTNAASWGAGQDWIC
jgi:hypothetical protein